MPHSKPPQEIIDTIQANHKFLVIAHAHPDADAYGAALGLTAILKKIGKHAIVAIEGAPSERYSNISGFAEILDRIPTPTPDQWLIVVDCGSFERIGEEEIERLKAANIINIDHHFSNNGFGKLNWINPASSSASEMIYEIASVLKCEINTEIATAIMYGIVGDTGSFRYSSTSARTLEIASKLVAAGAKITKVHQAIFSDFPLNVAKLKAEVILNAEFLFDNQLALGIVSNALYKKFNCAEKEVDGLVENLRDIKGVLAGALVKQDGELWRVSLRSSKENLDVAAIAASFGGGGHKMAAAFRWRQDLEKLVEKLKEEFNKAFARLD
ncbi:MAG TPA: bifunctional oligoribonuclease/PAP phosphatase NrnA [Oligoflexia bacterium]|nr:bifunctional oligoribonuclease/PAP phosphatase NrnA [Oligoflexia bacterium]HMP27615.1 bifunctional oligoribonuclease/PAP phosphatase NrnA [Oligoflexia bacterium]